MSRISIQAAKKYLHDNNIKCGKPHYKSFGDRVNIDHMHAVLNFSEKKMGDNPALYRHHIYECEECGTRALGTLGGIFSSDRFENSLDKFINHEISTEQFQKVLDEDDFISTVTKYGELNGV